MNLDEIAIKWNERFADAKAEVQKGEAGQPWILVPPSAVVRMIEFLKAECGVDYLANLSAVDYESSFAVVYQLRSLAAKFDVMLKTSLDKEAPSVPTISHIFGAADWFERESYDLLGIQFENHPDLRRIMMPEDWAGHPLRKDYTQPEEYRGIPCTRPDSHQLFETLPAKAPAPQEKSDAPVDAKEGIKP